MLSLNRTALRSVPGPFINRGLGQRRCLGKGSEGYGMRLGGPMSLERIFINGVESGVWEFFPFFEHLGKRI